MSDTMIKDLIALTVILVYIVLLALNHPIDPKLEALAMAAFGFLFKGTTSWSLSNPFKKAVPVFLVFLLLGSGIARADIFNPIGPGTNGKYKTFLASVNGPSGNTLTDLSNILNYLGATTGEAYNGRLQQWDTTVGATIVSLPAYNLSLGAETLLSLNSGSLIDGWAETNSFNIGQWLNSVTNVATIPVLQYLTAASISLSFGEEKNNKDNYEFAPLIGGTLKWSF